MRLLPPIDLARNAVLPSDMALRELRKLKIGFAPHTYNPMRKLLPDILNVEAAAFGSAARTDWATIAREISKASRFASENEVNQLVANGLYKFAVDTKFVGRQQTFFPLAVGLSAKISYWTNAVFSYDGEPLVVFIDPRKAKSLTREARRFVFSLMHERIRAADPDFAQVRLGIFQFHETEAGARVANLRLDEGVNLFSFEELNDMIRETYRLWYDVLNEREEDTRKRASGIRGGLI